MHLGRDDDRCHHGYYFVQLAVQLIVHGAHVHYEVPTGCPGDRGGQHLHVRMHDHEYEQIVRLQSVPIPQLLHGPLQIVRRQ